MKADKPKKINTLINIIIYAGITLLIVLGIKFLYELIKRKKNKYLKSLRLLLNFGIILTFCFGAFLKLALIVSLPSEITNSKEQSLDNLSKWIFNEELKIDLIGLGIIFILGLFNYLYQFKVEKLNLIKPIISLTLINCLILILSLFLIYRDTYNGLVIEIG